MLKCGCRNVPMVKISQLAPTVLFTAISRLERRRSRRLCNTPDPGCCFAIRYSLLPTSWMVSERPGTPVSSRASKDCIRKRNDKRPSPVYYTQSGSTKMDGLSNHVTERLLFPKAAVQIAEKSAKRQAANDHKRSVQRFLRWHLSSTRLLQPHEVLSKKLQHL